jgi:hypothetical protein
MIMADLKSDDNDRSEIDPVNNCSFCGRSQDEVNNLIAGPDVYICDECVFLFAGIIVEGHEGPLKTDSHTAELLKNLRYIHKVLPRSFSMACAYLKGVSDTVREKHMDGSR